MHNCVYVCVCVCNFMEGHANILMAGDKASEPVPDCNAKEKCEAVCAPQSQNPGPSVRLDNEGPEEDFVPGAQQPSSAFGGKVLRVSGQRVSSEEGEREEQSELQGWVILSYQAQLLIPFCIFRSMLAPGCKSIGTTIFTERPLPSF